MESVHANNVSHTFRIWQYFRVGWATYFGLLFAALNTIITTYYLAIDNIGFLENIFPTFGHYVITMILIGIPVLSTVGYIHTKRTAAYKEEAVIKAETNPHHMREVINSELLLVIVDRLNKLLMKKLTNVEFTKKELSEMDILKEKIQVHTSSRTISDTILTDIDEIIKGENHE
jgi:hypothetical protein